jgi:hypothetical protein
MAQGPATVNHYGADHPAEHLRISDLPAHWRHPAQNHYRAMIRSTTSASRFQWQGRHDRDGGPAVTINAGA